MEDDWEMEKKYFIRIVRSLFDYGRLSGLIIEKKKKDLESISTHYQDIIRDDYESLIKELESCYAHNNNFFELLAIKSDDIFHITEADEESIPKMTFDKPMYGRVCTTLRQLFRDWSDNGAQERKECYDPIINKLEELYSDSELRPEINILLPGCGLARLMLELASRGFCCEGNEFSYHMIIASDVMLNSGLKPNSIKIFPWISDTTNYICKDDLLYPVYIPDQASCTLKENLKGSMSFKSGDFLEIYTDAEVYDCIVTCFFIDTAHNIVEYIEKIYNILKPGGHWLNLGPLLYHFQGSPSEISIELPYETIRKIIVHMGFLILEELFEIPTSYLCNPKSMLQSRYNSLYFLAKK